MQGCSYGQAPEKLAIHYLYGKLINSEANGIFVAIFSVDFSTHIELIFVQVVITLCMQ